jgi:hypothetical protein
VTAIPRPDVPETRVAAQPRRSDAACGRRRLGDPRRFEIVVFLEIEIEEVVGGRAARRGPGARGGVEAAIEIGSDLDEADEIGACAGESADVETVGPELRRDADAQDRQRCDALRERSARVPARCVYPFTAQE